jgi:hypothetical protein
MVECGGVVMFGVPIFTHPFACDFLNITHIRKVNKFVVSVCTCGITPVLLVCTSVLSRLSLCFYVSAVFRALASRIKIYVTNLTRIIFCVSFMKRKDTTD